MLKIVYSNFCGSSMKLTEINSDEWLDFVIDWMEATVQMLKSPTLVKCISIHSLCFFRFSFSESWLIIVCQEVQSTGFNGWNIHILMCMNGFQNAEKILHFKNISLPASVLFPKRGLHFQKKLMDFNYFINEWLIDQHQR